jgi:hypothetical protein
MPTFLLHAALICFAFFGSLQNLYAVTFSPEDVIYKQDHNNDGRQLMLMASLQLHPHRNLTAFF